MSRRKRRNVKEKVFGEGHVFLDATDCGSTVSFRVYRTRWNAIGGNIVLTDCNRKIEWALYEARDFESKIDKVIDILLAAKAVMTSAKARRRK